MNFLSPTYISGADDRLLRRLLASAMRGRVLDVGCGRGELKRFLPAGTSYVGMETEADSGADVVGDAHQLPFADASFDSVMCTSVLEHVQDERRAVKEMYRVLKPGGRVLITIPFMLHYHKDPEDYRRLTHAGLAALLKETGFSDVSTYNNCGVYTVIEFDLFSLFVHARREKLWFKRWYLPLYYGVALVFFGLFKVINYVTYPLQQNDTSLYVGVAAVATK
jgi:ubiquinone/menaquinone biosynthesis C-methylase UbiE